MPDLFANRYVVLTSEQGSAIVRWRRNDVPYASYDDVRLCHEELAWHLDQHGRAGRGLLVDMRGAQLNNDPEFEAVATAARELLVRGFGKVAVLVATAVGALQVRRHIREDGRDIPVFQDEAEAIAHLLRADTIRPPSAKGEPPSSRRARGRRSSRP